MDILSQLVSYRRPMEGSNRVLSRETPENKTAPKRRHSVVSVTEISGLHNKVKGRQQENNRGELRNGNFNNIWRRKKSCPEYEKQPEEWRRLEEDKNDPEKRWKEWGPYLSERQWATVREDYSYNGSW